MAANKTVHNRTLSTSCEFIETSSENAAGKHIAIGGEGLWMGTSLILDARTGLRVTSAEFGLR
jgi:hypothetical protein